MGHSQPPSLDAAPFIIPAHSIWQNANVSTVKSHWPMIACLKGILHLNSIKFSTIVLNNFEQIGWVKRSIFVRFPLLNTTRWMMINISKMEAFENFSFFSIKSVYFKKTVFNTTSADIKTKSADVVLKTTTILKKTRIAQLSS